MALIKCNECSKEISDKATSCPNCGAPQATVVTKRQLMNPVVGQKKEAVEEEKIRCPKCNSDQITADKKGFSAGKAIVGGVLTGGIGLLAGFHGSKKLVLYCMACGNKFKPGAKPAPKPPPKKPVPEKVLTPAENKRANRNANIGCFAVLIVIVAIVAGLIISYHNCAWTRVPDKCLDDPRYLERIAKERKEDNEKFREELQKKINDGYYDSK